MQIVISGYERLCIWDFRSIKFVDRNALPDHFFKLSGLFIISALLLCYSSGMGGLRQLLKTWQLCLRDI